MNRGSLGAGLLGARPAASALKSCLDTVLQAAFYKGFFDFLIRDPNKTFGQDKLHRADRVVCDLSGLTLLEVVVIMNRGSLDAGLLVARSAACVLKSSLETAPQAAFYKGFFDFLIRDPNKTFGQDNSHCADGVVCDLFGLTLLEVVVIVNRGSLDAGLLVAIPAASALKSSLDTAPQPAFYKGFFDFLIRNPNKTFGGVNNTALLHLNRNLLASR